MKNQQNLTIADTLAGEPELRDIIRQELEDTLEKVSELKNERALWALRLCIIAHMPLTDEELQRLSVFAGRSLADVRNCIQEMTNRVDAKVRRKIGAIAKAVTLWHEIRQLEYKLREEKKLSRSSVAIDELIKKIQEKSEQREEWLKRGQMLCRPSNEDIAFLIGLPEDKVHRVSLILLRARQELLKG